MYVATAEVKLESRLGASARAIGVIPRSHTRTMATGGTTIVRTQISSIHSLQWERRDASAPYCIIEWVENLSSKFIWPHSDDTKETGEKRRTLSSPAGEFALSTPIESRSGNQSCVHLVIEGIERFIGESRAKVPYIANPGFILYKGAPDQAIRFKIRDCLSLAA